MDVSQYAELDIKLAYKIEKQCKEGMVRFKK